MSDFYDDCYSLADEKKQRSRHAINESSAAYVSSLKSMLKAANKLNVKFSDFDDHDKKKWDPIIKKIESFLKKADTDK